MKSSYHTTRGVWILGAVIALLHPGAAASQEAGRIAGRVTAAATSRPLPGAQVYVAGLRIGALTNEEGRFVILNVPVGGQTVRVDIIGFESLSRQVTIAAGAVATADFSLAETAISLDELVVTGTAAEVRSREVGNSLDAITSRQIESLQFVNPEQVLSGRIPGLTITPAGGAPGSGATVRIRGQTSASQGVEPLIYIDGVRVYNLPINAGDRTAVAVSPLQDIAAEDVERVEVVKGAAATTLYGTDAASGVIQIFTKRGVAGEPIWTAEASAGFNSMQRIGPDGDPSDLFTRCSDTQYLYGLSQSSKTAGQEVYFADPTCPANGRWFQTRPVQRYALSVRGGSDRVSYYVSTSYRDDQGTLEDQRSRDGGYRANLDFTPTEGLTVSLNTAYTRRSSSFVESGNNTNGFLLNVGRGPYGNFKGGKGEDCVGVTAPALCVTNSYLFDTDNRATSDRYTTGLVLEYAPFERMSNRLAVGWDNLNLESEQLRPFGYLAAPLGSYSSENNARTKLSIDYAGSFRQTFGQALVSTFSWGGQIFRDRFRTKYVSTEGFAGPGTPLLTSGGVATDVRDAIVATTNAGAFLQNVVGYHDRLFVTAGLRVDGNSAFGDDFGLQYYPKLSASYVLSDHAFWPTGWINTFKLRGAVGESGKAPGAFDKLRTWSPVTGGEGLPGFTPNDIGNDKVGPERTREIEVGFDASLLHGRIGLEATRYMTRTTDGLVPVTYPPSDGFLSAKIENVGIIEGAGTELQVTLVPWQSNDVEWRLQANLAWMTNEAVDLGGQQLETGRETGVREGDPVPSYYGPKILNPGDFAEPVLQRDSYVGPLNPTEVFGITTDITIFDRLNIQALFEHQGGHYLLNGTGYQNARRGAWFPCYEIQKKMVAARTGSDPRALNDVKAKDRARCFMNLYGGYEYGLWLEKADFWKLRNLSVTYDLPSAWVRAFASRASVTVTGTNLMKWTDYSGVDPETEEFNDRAGGGGVYDGAGAYARREYYTIPAPRTFLVSFRLTF